MHYAVFIFSIIALIILGGIYKQLQLKLIDSPNKYGVRDYTTLYLISFYLIAFAILRSKVVGNDTSTYIELFKSIATNNDFPQYSNRYEFGYLIYNKICSLVSKKPQTIIIVTGIITTTCYLFFIKRYSKSIILSIFLFIFLRFYDDTLNVLRQCLAICIIFTSYKYLLNRNFIKFIFCIIIAFLFHKTAIIFLLAWWITSIKLNKKNLLLLSIIAIALSIQFGTIFQQALIVFDTYSYYEGGIYFGETRLATIVSLIIQLFLFVIAYYIYSLNSLRISNSDEKMLMLWFTGICILTISTQFNLFDRIATYFNVFSIIVLPNMIDKIKNLSNKKIIEASIFLLLLCYYVAILELRPSWNRIFPYEITTDL